MTPQELWMDLRVRTEQATADIQKGMGKTFGGGAKGGLATSPKGIISEILGKELEGLRRVRTIKTPALPSSPAFEKIIRPPSYEMRKMIQQDRAKFMRDATFAMMPMLNPISPWAALFANRQIFSAMSGTQTGRNLVRSAGLSGTTGAAVMTGGIFTVLISIGLSIKALSKTIEKSIQAYRDAATMYSKALGSGLGIGFTTKRAVLAGVMGVAEQDVFKFGLAFQYLNPQIEWASRILARTNQNLTSVGWSFKIMDLNFKAFFADIANDAAPAVRRVSGAISDLVKAADAFYNQHKKAGGVAVGAGALAAMPLTTLAAFTAAFLTGGRKDLGAAPPPLPWMKQLPASRWEHMGLGIGATLQSDYARRTARATEAIERMMMQGRYSQSMGWGLFGMSPNTGNP